MTLRPHQPRRSGIKQAFRSKLGRQADHLTATRLKQLRPA